MIETFFNNSQYFLEIPKLTSLAKLSVKICKQEMYEIETCHECYYNANTKKDWFAEVCSKPHILLWAKLKSFPYWPAKAMVTNSAQLVSVRFFGDHDRAWVPVKDCYLYSFKDPNTFIKNKRNNIAESIKEVEYHISKIKARFGAFNYAALRVPFDPTNIQAQFQMMIPNWDKSTYSTKIEPDAALNCTKSKLTYKIIKTADNNLSISPVSGGQFRLNGSDSFSSISAYSSPSKKDDSMIELSIKSPMKESGSKSNSAKSSPKSSSKIIIKEVSSSATVVSPTHQNAISNKITIERKNFDGGQKTYQILRRKSTDVTSDAGKIDDSSSPTKVESEKLKRVIIKRKSNNWNMLTIPLKKKNRSSSEESKNSKTENTIIKISDDDEKEVEHKTVQKRKRSFDEKSIVLKIAKSSSAVHVVSSANSIETNKISEEEKKEEKLDEKNDKSKSVKTKEKQNNENTANKETNLVNERLKEKNDGKINKELDPKIINKESLQQPSMVSLTLTQQPPSATETSKTDENEKRAEQNNPIHEIDPLMLPDEIKTELDDPFDSDMHKEPPSTRVLRSQSKSNEKGHNHTSPIAEKEPKKTIESISPKNVNASGDMSGDSVIIKSEPASEDEDVVEKICTRSNDGKTNPLLINVPSRGFVTVRDINKMKNIAAPMHNLANNIIPTMQSLNIKKKG